MQGTKHTLRQCPALLPRMPGSEWLFLPAPLLQLGYAHVLNEIGYWQSWTFMAGDCLVSLCVGVSCTSKDRIRKRVARLPPLPMQVFLTDYLDAVLTNLRACMHLNSAAGSASANGLTMVTPPISDSTAATAAGSVDAVGCSGEATGSAGLAYPGESEGAGEQEGEEEGFDPEAFDPEDASECSDLDGFLAEAAGVPQQAQQQEVQMQQNSWDVVRPAAFQCVPPAYLCGRGSRMQDDAVPLWPDCVCSSGSNVPHSFGGNQEQRSSFVALSRLLCRGTLCRATCTCGFWTGASPCHTCCSTSHTWPQPLARGSGMSSSMHCGRSSRPLLPASAALGVTGVF